MFDVNQLEKIAFDQGFKEVKLKSGNYSAATMFYYSLNANYYHDRRNLKALVLRLVSLIVRLCLNILHYFYPLSGEEIILIAKK